MTEVLAVETLIARGHPNIRATHRSTLEITRDPEVSPRGDCIIAVAATKAAADLDSTVKQAIKTGKRVTLFLVAQRQGLLETVSGWGHRSLNLSDTRSIVVRKSTYTDNRTVAVQANKAARDLDRALIAYLRQPDALLKVYIVVHEKELSPSLVYALGRRSSEGAL